MTIPPARPVQKLLALGVGLLVACSPGPPKSRTPATSASAASRPVPPAITASHRDTVSVSPSASPSQDTLTPAPDSLAPAYRQFAKFLDLAVATRIPHVGLVDSVYSRGSFEDLGISEQDLDMRWLAASRILSVRTGGDSGQATAVITRVARQTPESVEGHYAVRSGIQDDTACWRLVRDAYDGRWKVEGDGWMVDDPRVRFTVLPLGRDLHWVTGSPDQAQAAVDSIRRARGLEVVR